MIYNPFRDQLIMHHFDTFRLLVDEIRDIKADLKSKQRRVKPPAGTYTAYHLTMAVCSPLVKILRTCRLGEETTLQLFKSALKKLHFLIEEMKFCGTQELIDMFQHIYNRLFNLLPQRAAVQHALFDAQQYDTGISKPVSTKGFINWLQDYHLQGFLKRDIARRMAFKPFNIVQQSIKLRIA